MELGTASINLLYCNLPFLITNTPSLFIESSTSFLPTLACHEDLERKEKGLTRYTTATGSNLM